MTTDYLDYIEFKGEDVKLPEDAPEDVLDAIRSFDELDYYLDDAEEIAELANGEGRYTLTYIGKVGPFYDQDEIDQTIGEYYADFLDWRTIGENLRGYFDYRKYGQDIRFETSGTFFVVDNPNRIADDDNLGAVWQID